MSNRPDDDFDFGDEFDDEFDFGDEDLDFDLSDDEFDFGGDQDVPADFEPIEEPQQGQGRRTFLFAAIALILLFVIGLVAIVALAVLNAGPSDLELTATSIVETNNAVQVALNQTATENAVLAITQTFVAGFSPTPSPSPTPTETPTNTPTPTVDATELARLQLTMDVEATQTADALATLEAEQGGTQVAINMTNTAIAQQTIDAMTPALGAEQVAQTATALALTLNPPTNTPAEGETQVVVVASATPGAVELPETGLFDDIGGGGRNNIGMIALMAFGLVGVIVISRRMRK